MNPPRGVPRRWTVLAHTAGVTVDELHWHDVEDNCYALLRVTDDLTGEQVTLSAEQWSTALRTAANAGLTTPLAPVDAVDH